MPPLLALIICTIFVLFMLWTDRRQFPEGSLALWLPTIWMLLIFSKPLGVWFQISGATMEEGSPLDRAFLIILLIIALIILTKRKFNMLRTIKENIWLALLIIYMLLSCTWADMPLIASKRCSREFIAVIMAFVVASDSNPRQALESVFRRIIYVLIPYSYVLINYFSQYGRMYIHHEGALMWTGVTVHKNSLAQLCLFSALFLIWTFIRRNQGNNIPAWRYQTILEVFILLMAFYLWGGPEHTLTYSATATVAFAIGLSVFVLLYRMKKLRARPTAAVLIASLIIAIAYGTVTPFLGKLSIIDISSTLGREETLKGRADVWRKVVPTAMERPILGHGFSSFWTTATREKYAMTNAHNGYLDLILSVGLAGFFLYVSFLLSNMRSAQRVMAQDYDWGNLWICFLLMGVVINMTESSFNTFTSKLMAIILFLTLSFSKIYENQPKFQRTV